MNEPHDLAKRSRIRACNYCRQNKLKCDAPRDSKTACSRCSRRGVECVYSPNFQRVRRPKTYQLLAELETLRRETRSNNPDPAPSISFPSILGGMEPDASQKVTDEAHEGVVEEARRGNEPITLELDMPYEIAEYSSVPSNNVVSLPRTIQNITVSGEDIDACFQIFLKHNLAYVPILDSSLQPNDCYQYSPLLFWTILAIGSMRFETDPTLILALGPEVIGLAKEAVFSCKDVIATVQSFTLLCAWPMPVDTLEKDPSPALAGAALQLAVNSGLHVWGIGQDFSRRRLDPGGRNSADFRARLWVNCLITCQRVNIMYGVPPPVVPDTYRHEKYGDKLSSVLSPSVEFQRQLCLIHSDGIINLEQNLTSRSANSHDLTLPAKIEELVIDLQTLLAQCPTPFDHFLLDGAILQVCCFQLLLPQSAFDSDKLLKLYDRATNFLRLGNELGRKQGMGEYAPPFFVRYMSLACCVILRIGRSSLRDSLDLKRGRDAYFQTINLHKRIAVRQDDSLSRSMVILSQLWVGQFIDQQTKRNGGQLRLRCRSRLGMSLLYDSWWYWRQEFQGHPDPYPHEDNVIGSSSENPALQVTTPTSLDLANSMDLWWPSHEIFTGIYTPVGGKPGLEGV